MSDSREAVSLSASELAQLSASTVGHYNANAQDFWEGTRGHDVSQNVDALLSAVKSTGPLDILDLGCGPGRDLITFREMGHRPVGLDGSEAFCKMARIHSDCEVWHQDFLKLDLPPNRFDGVFANATLFHIPRQELPRILRQLLATLRPSGVLFSSNPRGPNLEAFNGDRFGAYHNLTQWRAYMNDAGFSYVDHYFRPKGLPREEQPWLASVWRKPAIELA